MRQLRDRRVSQLMAKTIKAYNEPADDEDAPEVPLPHARLHDLRHVHATLLLVAGVPVHVVADRYTRIRRSRSGCMPM